MPNHTLKPEQRTALINQQLDQLRTERFQHELNIARWKAIPAELQDGTEQPAIEQTEHAIKVLEAQIGALDAMLTPRRG